MYPNAKINFQYPRYVTQVPIQNCAPSVITIQRPAGTPQEVIHRWEVSRKPRSREFLSFSSLLFSLLSIRLPKILKGYFSWTSAHLRTHCVPFLRRLCYPTLAAFTLLSPPRSMTSHVTHFLRAFIIVATRPTRAIVVRVQNINVAESTRTSDRCLLLGCYI